MVVGVGWQVVSARVGGDPTGADRADAADLTASCRCRARETRALESLQGLAVVGTHLGADRVGIPACGCRGRSGRIVEAVDCRAARCDDDGDGSRDDNARGAVDDARDDTAEDNTAEDDAARDISTGNVSARNISTRNISTRNVSARGRKSR
jgi:hypothetical protein